MSSFVIPVWLFRYAIDSFVCILFSKFYNSTTRSRTFNFQNRITHTRAHAHTRARTYTLTYIDNCQTSKRIKSLNNYVTINICDITRDAYFKAQCVVHVRDLSECMSVLCLQQTKMNAVTINTIKTKHWRLASEVTLQHNICVTSVDMAGTCY